MILAPEAGFWSFGTSFYPKSLREMYVTQLIIDGYTHVEFEGIVRHEFDPWEKNLVKRGRKMVKDVETGSEITKAHTWTPYKPNIFSLTAPGLTKFIGSAPGDIPKADRVAWVKKWTVIGGRKRQFRRYWQRRRSFRYDFESMTTRRLQRRLELHPEYYRRPVRRLPTRSDRRWSRTEGPSGWEANAPQPSTSGFTIHTAISSVSAQVK